MSTLLAGLILVSGYYYSIRNPYIRYKYLSLSKENERFYFYTVKVGVLIFIFSFILSVAFNSSIDIIYNKSRNYYAMFGIFQYFESHVLACFKSEPNRDNITLLVLLFLVSYIVPLIRKFLITDEKERNFYIEVVSTIPSEAMIYDAVMNNIPVMINLIDNRFYIGLIYYEGDYIRRRETISIMPLRSGYRDSDNNLVFTTNYAVTFSRYYKELKKRNNMDNIKNPVLENSVIAGEYNRFNDKMKKVIFLSQVESLTLFDFDLYEKYFEDKK